MPVHLAFIAGKSAVEAAHDRIFSRETLTASGQYKAVLRQFIATGKVRAAAMLRQKHAAQPALTKP